MWTRHIARRLRASASPLLLLGAALCPLGMAAPAAAQVVEPAEARAIMLRRLAFFRVDDLDFGSIVPGPAAGVVRIHPDGSRTATGGVTLAGSDHRPARFAGMGSYNQQVRIHLSSNTIQLTGPGAPMTVSQFEIGSDPTAILSTSPTSFRIASTNGTFVFPIGGRLAVGANQAPGVYAGTFTITLNYM